MTKETTTQKNLDPGELLTRTQLARMLKCSVNTVTRLTKQGMPAYYVGAMQHSGRGSRPRYNLDKCKMWLDARARAFNTPPVPEYVTSA